MDQLLRRIRAAAGDIAPDLVLKRCRIINVFTCEITEGDIAVTDGTVVGIGSYDGPDTLDIRGRYVSPGFIDGHLHIESSMLCPPELARAVIPSGTTTIIADPHEIANVLGKRGIRYMLDISRGLPVDFYFMLPSCVPATGMETSGADLSVQDLLEFKDEEMVLGLAEMMNYPGVISGFPSVIEKIRVFCDRVKDGHAPLLSGNALNAYLSAGIRSDHECTRLEEAREKLRLGMHIMIREGTQAKNLDALLSLASPLAFRKCSLVTDDLHPHDLVRKGHLNHLLDMAVARGIEPAAAIAMVTLNTAEYFGLPGLGAIAPGYQADLVVLSSLNPLKIDAVLKKGRIVYADGTLYCEPSKPVRPPGISPMLIKSYGPDTFSIPARGSSIRVIGVVPDQIITTHDRAAARIERGLVTADPENDIIKIVVVERHRATGNVGLGMVRGLGLRTGALASSVSHDSHNIICVGCSDRDMYEAVRAVEAMGGGLAAAQNGRVLARFSLPIGGLMSDRPLEETAKGWEYMRKVALEMGSTPEEPFMAMSFLALPVIPELKITDRGLVDVNRVEHVSLFMD
ncbi:MAG: adenine deaminase [Syntrophales bacterium]